MPLSMPARYLRLCTLPEHSATSRSNAAVIVSGEEQTGIACSDGSSLLESRLWMTSFDAGNRKSSMISCRRRKLTLETDNLSALKVNFF